MYYWSLNPICQSGTFPSKVKETQCKQPYTEKQIQWLINQEVKGWGFFRHGNSNNNNVLFFFLSLFPSLCSAYLSSFVYCILASFSYHRLSLHTKARGPKSVPVPIYQLPWKDMIDLTQAVCPRLGPIPVRERLDLAEAQVMGLLPGSASWTEYLCTPKTRILIPTSQCGGVGEGSLWKVIRMRGVCEDRALLNEVSALIKITKELARLCSLPCEDTSRQSTTWRGFSPEPNCAGT